MVAENKDQHDAKAHLYLEEARWRRDDQIRRSDALERKLVTAFTLNVAVIAIFGASLGIAGGPFSLAVECLVYSTVFLFVIGLGFATRADLGAAWNRAPDLDILQQLLGRFDDDTINVGLQTQSSSALRKMNRHSISEAELQPMQCCSRHAQQRWSG